MEEINLVGYAMAAISRVLQKVVSCQYITLKIVCISKNRVIGDLGEDKVND